MDILVPIFICAVMPVAIVFLVFYPKINSDNRRAQVLMKAIESGNSLDADKLAQALNAPQETTPKRTPQEELNRRLHIGILGCLLGVALISVTLISDSYLSDEMGFFFMLIGSLLAAVGLSYLIVYFVTRKQVKD